jgi:hypothetical protein
MKSILLFPIFLILNKKIFIASWNSKEYAKRKPFLSLVVFWFFSHQKWFIIQEKFILAAIKKDKIVFQV